FGVGGGVAERDRAVAGLGDHLARGRIDHHGADRRLAARRGVLRAGEGDAHGAEGMVKHSWDPTAPEAQRQDDDSEDGGGGAHDGERVAKALARAGVASRRDVERLIEAGRVAINGKVLSTPAVKVAPGDILTVDGVVAADAEPTRMWRYHKPVGLVTTHKDPHGRPTVFEDLA